MNTLSPSPALNMDVDTPDIDSTQHSPSPSPTPSPSHDSTPISHSLPSINKPHNQQQVHALLNRFALLNNNNNTDNTINQSNQSKLEQIAILNTLLSLDSSIISSSINNQNLSNAWLSNSESIDNNLLKNQLLGLQLLSKDIDLPTELSLEYLQSLDSNISSNISTQLSSSTTPSSTNNLQLNSLPLDDYNEKAKLLGIIPNRPIINPNFNTVGLPEMEDSIKLKIDTRIKELESLPTNIGSYNSSILNLDLNYSNDQILYQIDDLKIDALVELKSLKLLTLQKKLRNHLLIKAATNTIYHDENLNNYSVFKTWKRTYCVHPKQKILQTSKLQEKLQFKQLQEQKIQFDKIHIKNVEKIQSFASNIQNSIAQFKINKLQFAKSIHQFHQQSERDESKKLEKTAKQRLQALKANDEEAYIKLLDQTKDKRITHLLKQTNSFLDSLANAVKVQQNESKNSTDKSFKQSKKINQIDDSNQNISNTDNIDNNDNNNVDNDDDLTKQLKSKNEKIDYYDVAHKIKEEVNNQPKILVGGTLKEYQIKGLEWMVSLYNNHLNGILADEMGLGKTIQSIALITYLIEKKKESGKFLIIVPLSTITNWTLEFDQWAPSLKTIVYKGNQNQRKDLHYQIRSGDFSVLLTTYEYVIKDRPLLSKFKWAHMLIDEGHRLKNTGSKLFQTLTTYYNTKNRLILTGTPLQNNLPELWALLNFILPKVFNSVKSFDEWFNTPFANTGQQEKLELSEEESLLIIRRLHKVLRPFLLRRLKKDVAKDLPDKVEKVIKCKFSSLQEKIYKQLLHHNALFIGEGAIGATKSGLKGLNNKIMQLRKVCNHPFVFEEVETLVNPDKSTTDMIWRSSGKFELLDRILPKLKRTGHRVLIFFQMTQVMDIMEDFLRLKDLKYMRLDGSTKAEDRQLMLKDFNAPDSEYFCFLLSTRAGGLGLNLQTADTVIIFDTDWNPHQDLQAQDRAHRIGQKNEVKILRLITSESVEEVILEKAHQKLDIDGKVIQAGKFDNKSSAEEQEAYLKRLLEEDKDKDKNNETDNYDDFELNEILSRGDDEMRIFHEIDLERAKIDKEIGKPRLMDDSEVPQVFKDDMSIHLVEKDDPSGRRNVKRVVYDDGLTEEQWLQAMDNDNDSVEAAIERKRLRMEKIKNKSLEEEDDVENEEENEDNIHDDANSDSDEEVYEDDIPSRKRQRLSRGSTPLTISIPASKIDKKKPTIPQWMNRAYILIDELEKLNDEDGNNVGGIFVKLPSRKFYADYYKIIKHVVSLGQIKKQLDGRKIESWEDFTSELDQMFVNAGIYNEEGSWVIKCANLLKAHTEKMIKKWDEDDAIENIANTSESIV